MLFYCFVRFFFTRRGKGLIIAVQLIMPQYCLYSLWRKNVRALMLWNTFINHCIFTPVPCRKLPFWKNIESVTVSQMFDISCCICPLKLVWAKNDIEIAIEFMLITMISSENFYLIWIHLKVYTAEINTTTVISARLCVNEWHSLIWYTISHTHVTHTVCHFTSFEKSYLYIHIETETKTDNMTNRQNKCLV